MADFEPWRESQPELHKFARRISDLFPIGPRRQWLLTQLQEYKAAGERFEESQRQWKEDRREYFEIELPKQFASFRDETSCHKSLMWDTYERLLKSQQGIDGVPTKLRRATCVRLWPRDGRLTPTRMTCLTDKGNGTGSINVCGWIPPHLYHFDDIHRPTEALPPIDLPGGRSYTLPEICYSLCVIHDADGAYAPFAARDSEIAELFGCDIWWTKARVRGEGIINVRAADESWLTSLEPLMDEAVNAVTSACPNGTRQSNAHHAHDNKLFPRGSLDDSVLMGAIAALHDSRKEGSKDIEILRGLTGETKGNCPRALGLQKRIRKARQDGRTSLPAR